MNSRTLLCVLLVGVLAAASVFAQPFTPRQDYVWARAIPTGTTMTLDGKVSEAVWAQADSIVLRYGTRAGDPGSGYTYAGDNKPTDGVRAVIKFLSDPVNKKMYFAIIAKDSSVGGAGWEACDGMLASIGTKGTKYSGLKEINYWWLDQSESGKVPNPGGWLPIPDVFNGKVTVQGVPSNDTTGTGAFVADTGYVMEMVLALDSIGINPAATTGDVLPINICFWDGDYFWPPNLAKKSYNRTWWQGEWSGRLNGKVLFNPAVTTTSGAAPAPPAEIVVKNGVDFATPTVDGALTDNVWNYVPSFRIKYGDLALRASYPGVGPATSGQFQPGAGGPGTVSDTGVCTVKMFFKGDMLYLGFDVTDKKLVANGGDDMMDGVWLSMTVPTDSLRDKGNGTMASQRFGLRLDSTATTPVVWVSPVGDLDALAKAGGASYGMALKPKANTQPSTINNPGDNDAGYTMELALDLTKLGYTAGALNKIVLFGISYMNSNVYSTTTDNFSTRTWWFREWPWNAPGAVLVLDNSTKVTGVEENANQIVPGEFRIYEAYPNPFNPTTTLKFALPSSGSFTLRVYDMLGRLIHSHAGVQTSAGTQQYVFNASSLASGVYYYNVEFISSDGVRQMSRTGKMMLLK